MSVRLKCEQGHEWDSAEAVEQSRCPQCGGVPVMANGASTPFGVETVQYAPKSSRAVDLTAATLGPDEPAWVLPAGERPRIGEYQIIDEIGRGGMGVVYKAEQLSLKRPVALKMILAGSHASRDHHNRFVNEALAVARLQHSNIVQIYEIGEHEGKHFLALEYVGGGTLAQRLTAAGNRPSTDYRETARVLECLARAVHHAHLRNIIHRDLKPGNVLLMADGTPKITDFGLAKQLQGDTPATASGATTVTGTIMGTPSYMAPEQADGKRRVVGPAADIYSLGAILYELITGQPPFKGDSPMSTAIKVLTEEPVPPRRLLPRVPRDLETICLKCLEKDPAKRYATAEALADDLRRFQQGEPISARRVGVFGRTSRWFTRRWKAALFVLAGFFLALTLIFILGIIEHYRTSDANGDKTAATLEQELAGAWRLVSEKVADFEIAYPAEGQAETKFEAGRLSGRLDGTYSLDVTKEPAQITIQPVGAAEGLIDPMYGIISIAGDELRLCYVGNLEKYGWPTDFTAEAGSGRVLLTMKRGPAPVVGDMNERELQKFQGNWALVSAMENGQAAPPEALADARVSCPERGGFTYRMIGQSGQSRIQLNAGKNPREVDFMAVGVEAGKQQLMSGLGIYEWKADDPDTVVVCFAPEGQPRPTDFSAGPGSGRVMITMTRIKPAAAAKSELPLPPDLNLVPRDATAFVSVRVSEFLAGESAKRLQESLSKGVPGFDELLTTWHGHVKQTLTIPPAEIERATFVLLDDNDAVMIIATKEPYDRDKLLKRKDASVEPLQPDPKRYYLITTKDWRYSVYLISDTVLLVGLSGAEELAPPRPAEPGKEPGKRPPRPVQLAGRPQGHVVEVRNDNTIILAVPEGVQVKEGQIVSMFRSDGKGDPLHRRLGFVEIVALNREQAVARPVTGQRLADRLEKKDVAVFVGRPAKPTPADRHTSIEDLIWQLPTMKSDGPLQAALQEAAGKHHLVAGFHPPAKMRQDLAAMLPDSLQIARPLLNATAAVGSLDVHTLTLRDDLTLDFAFRLQYADEAQAAQAFAAAQATQAVVRDSLGRWMQVMAPNLANLKGELAGMARNFAYLVDELAGALRSPRVVERQGNDVLINLPLRLDIAQPAKLQAEATEKVRESAERVRNMNNLRQIGIAVIHHNKATGKYPAPAIYDNDGKPLLSWRVLLLPYLGEEKLYKEFRLNESWDSPHNKALLPRMPRFFVPSGSAAPEPGLTFYQAIVGGGAGWEARQGLHYDDLKDGAKFTISLVEAAEAVPWTKPADVGYTPTGPLPRLGGRAGMHAAFFDGSVRFFPHGFDEKTLRALITRDGGEKVDVEKLP